MKKYDFLSYEHKRDYATYYYCSAASADTCFSKNKPLIKDAFISTSFKGLNHFGDRINKHAKSQHHNNAVLCFKQKID